MTHLPVSAQLRLDSIINRKSNIFYSQQGIKSLFQILQNLMISINIKYVIDIYFYKRFSYSCTFSFLYLRAKEKRKNGINKEYLI